jgi:hypothetical protein
MPPWPAAMADIAKTYASFLNKTYGCTLDGESTTVSQARFKAIIGEARRLLDSRQASQVAADPNMVIVYRIMRHTDLLCELFGKLIGDGAATREIVGTDRLSKPDRSILDQHSTELRKIWELGTNTVVLQTVTQLDGDIVNRVALRPNDDRDFLFRIHNESVNRSFRFWEMVAGLLRALVTGR